MDKAKISELLINAGLGEYKEAILEYAKRCIRLHASLAEDASKVAIGESHIGGLPDLPPDIAWPTRNGRPCEFIAQINLKDVAPFDEENLLPKEGILLFFFDGRDYEDKPYMPYQTGAVTIIFFDGDMKLLKRATEFPVPMEKWQHYRMCSVRFERDWMLPTWWSEAAYDLEEKVFHFNHKAAFDDISPVVKIYRELTDSLEPDKDHDKHHLFGHPEPVIQDDPLTDIPEV